MKISKDILLNLNLVVDNEWLVNYINLINANEFTQQQEYKTQCHHIIPKFYYKYNDIEINNSNANLVNLTFKDHILAHYYLCRCTTDNYKGFGYASINYILRNQCVKELPELSEFVQLLDNIEEYYIDYRNLIASSQTQVTTRLKKSKSMQQYWDDIKVNDIDRYNELCSIRSKALTGIKKSDEHKKKLSVIASNRIGEKNPFFGRVHTDELKAHWSDVHGLKVYMINSDGDVQNTFNSIKSAVRFIQDNNATNCKDSTIYKHLNHAFKNHSLEYGFYWKVEQGKFSNKHYSDEYLENLKNRLSESKGTKVIMFNSDIELQFNSLAKAANYIIDEGKDNIHYKNITHKIVKAINTNSELYGFYWKYY